MNQSLTVGSSEDKLPFLAFTTLWLTHDYNYESKWNNLVILSRYNNV